MRGIKVGNILLKVGNILLKVGILLLNVGILLLQVGILRSGARSARLEPKSSQLALAHGYSQFGIP